MLIFRCYKLLSIVLTYQLHLFSPLARSLSIFYVFFPHLWLKAFKQKDPLFLKHALEEMGPVFIKLGQFLSLRGDLIRSEYLSQLSLLQHAVSFEQDHGYFDKVLSQFMSDHPQADVDFQPVAAASIAQVYRGTVNGEKIALKIQKQQARSQIESDLKILYALVLCFSFFIPKRIRIFEVYQKIYYVLHQELNFLTECAQADALHHALRDQSYLQIPKIFWDYCTPEMIVMEYIDSAPLRLILSSKTISEKRKDKISHLLLESFVCSVFEKGIFHADLHPGNIFFDFAKEQIAFVDFGVVCQLDETLQAFVAEQLLCVLSKDFKRLSENFLRFQWSSVPLNELERQQFQWDLHAVIGPVLEKPLGKISIAVLLEKMIRIARKYQIKIQPSLLLLQKTMVSLEGLVCALSPHFSVLDHISERVFRFIHKKYHPLAVYHRHFFHLSPLRTLPSIHKDLVW